MAGRGRPAAGIARVLVLLIVGLASLGRQHVSAQTIQVKELLPRVGNYIQSFIDGFSNVVAEETYTQETRSPRRKRQLKSDLMLVKYPGADGWLVFRDTFEADGKPVRTEPERLTRLFLEPPESRLSRAREITAASAKYNLAQIGNVNNPLLVHALMQASNQPRFRFTLGNVEKSLGPDVRIIQFQEYQTPSLIKVDGNADIFVNGLMWVEQTTGRIVKTQFNVGRRGTGVEVITTFRADPELAIDVPATLKEWYPDGFGGDITGEATYSRFRRFQVTTAEDLKK